MAKKGRSPKKLPKSDRIFENLNQVVSQFLQGRNYRPRTEREIQDKLNIPHEHLPLLKKILDRLVQRGQISQSGGLYIWTRPEESIVKGTIRMHPKGFGFVQPEGSTLYQQDIFIPRQLTQNAVDGDIVEVLVDTESFSEKGPEGRVLSIVSRSRSHVAGIITQITKSGQILAYSPILGQSQTIYVENPSRTPLNIGDRVVMEILEWGGDEEATLCQLNHVIGPLSDPSKDVPYAVEAFQLRDRFSEEVVREAASFGDRVRKQDIDVREDLRSWEIFTIDPETAKDFDDALSLTRDSSGFYQLGVHIADVSHYVKEESALDQEARKRSNSTYFPGICIPMLPKELSDNLCSLREGVNRLTISVHMRFDPEGNMADYRISRSVIRSSKRFSYPEAKQVLDGAKKSVHNKTLEEMVQLCHLLKKKRYERGSIEFALPELSLIVNESGEPTHTVYHPYDITHQLVEEFMLKANETIAYHLTKMGKGLAYRVHDVPLEDNLKNFSSLAAAFGFQLSETPTAAELQKLFDEATQTPYGQYLATSYIRCMRLALYSPDNIGHYGLGLDYYCHFTSPIRRYADLVVHRILFGEEKEHANLQSITAHCSEQERISAKAETHVVLLKKLRLLQKMDEEKSDRQFDAIVSRVLPFGIAFEIVDLMLDSFLHVSELGGDYFEHDPGKQKLVGESTGSTVQAGTRITVMLSAIDLIHLEAKWHLVSINDGPKTQKKKKALPKRPPKRKPQSKNLRKKKKRR